jgi:spore coat polysaccharide biosynthesis protein SpsF
MKNVVCIIARTNSTRLEKKVLKKVNGISMIEYIIGKMKRSKYINEIYICTSFEKEDEILIEIANQNNIKYYAGDPASPIQRLMKVGEIENADNIIRVTGDNIFTDEVYLDLMLKYHVKSVVDYTRTEYLPIGVTPEIISIDALRKCYNLIPNIYSEYLLLYLFQPLNFNCQVIIPPKAHQHPDWSMTVDSLNDWHRTLDIVGDETKFLCYDEIVRICSLKQIRNLLFNADGQVKLPGNWSISFETFRNEIEFRIKKSNNIILDENEYFSMLDEQKL